MTSGARQLQLLRAVGLRLDTEIELDEKLVVSDIRPGERTRSPSEGAPIPERLKFSAGASARP